MPAVQGGRTSANPVVDVAAALARVHELIADACRDSGRLPGEVRLLPVSKTVGSDRIRAAWAAGETLMGENRVQEAARKADELADTSVRWSIIGPLQSNKIKKVADFAAELQSLDSHDVAAELDRRLERADRSMDVYVQVNTSAEPQKSGIAVDEVLGFTAGLDAYPRLRPVGLMTVAVHSDDPGRVSDCFATLARLRDRLRDRDGGGWPELSMGMSGDYALAIAHGSTVVRLGQMIFGARA